MEIRTLFEPDELARIIQAVVELLDPVASNSFVNEA